MSNLIPTPRADKNGKVVTRHVKCDVSKRNLGAGIPAPTSATAVKENAESLDRLQTKLAEWIIEDTKDFDALMDGDYDGDLEDERVSMKYYLNSMSPEFLRYLERIHSEELWRFEAIARLIEKRESEMTIKNILAFSHLVGRYPDEKEVYVKSLDSYPQLEQYKPLHEADEVVHSKVRALLEVTNTIVNTADASELHDAIHMVSHANRYKTSPVISSKELVDFILENHERSPEITAAIESRKVYDSESLRVILDHPEQALSNGAL